MPRVPVGPEEAQLKLFLANAIANAMRRRYRTLEIAAEQLDESLDQLSRVRNGHVDEMSIGWLFRVGVKVGVNVKIHVEEPAAA